MLNHFSTYDNRLEHNNVYGHVVELLSRNQDQSESVTPRLHLDLGCGYGRIAEYVRDQLGLTYVGIDADETALASLRERGFATHQISLDSYEATLAGLQTAANGERIASVTLIDTLEHLPAGDEVLRAIRDFIAEHTAIFVLSVPNTTHRDIGNKLVFGAWDYTDVGLLDHTHTRLFSDRFLTRVLSYAGLHTVDSYDVIQAKSDQYFPSTHPALAAGSLLRQALGQIRGHDPSAITNQLVRVCVAGPKTETLPFLPERETPRPFLSIITRTQGTRPECLAEVLCCLSGQTDRDFELIVVGHKLTEPRQKIVERLLEDSPTWLRNKTHLLLLDHGNRTHPLNEGFAAAKGDYIVILDDDDICFANWVETFRICARTHPGRLLRAVAGRQNIKRASTLGQPAIVATGPIEKAYPSRFDLFEHLRGNHTPPVSVAFPRGVFHDLGIKFDEDLTTTEDWDYILRVALTVGVSDIDTMTSIYHWWDDSAQSSRTDHDTIEWRQNHEWIYNKLDSQVLLLPPKSARRIREIMDDRDQKERELARLQSSLADPGGTEREQYAAALADVASILESTSWRLSRPLRFLARLGGAARPVQLSVCTKLSAEQLRVLVQDLHRSTSWKATRILRRLKDGY